MLLYFNFFTNLTTKKDKNQERNLGVFIFKNNIKDKITIKKV